MWPPPTPSDKQHSLYNTEWEKAESGRLGVSLIDRPDNALVDWPTVLSDPHLIPTSPHPLCQRLPFTTLLQPAEKALLEDWLRTSSSWRAERSFVCLDAWEEQRNSIGLKSLLRGWWMGNCMTGGISFTAARESMSYSVSDTKHKHLFTLFTLLLINDNRTASLSNVQLQSHVQGKAVIYSIIATFIILHNSTAFLHFSFVIMIIKNCLGCCSGRNSLSVIFPWQW